MGAFGLAAYLCGTIFVKRHNTKQALGVMSKSAELVHERNVSHTLVKADVCQSGARQKLYYHDYSQDTLLNPLTAGAAYIWVFIFY